MNKAGLCLAKLPFADNNIRNGIDFSACGELFRKFIANGGRYFDTSYTDLGGASEEALSCLLKEYPRNHLIIADKLPGWMIHTPEDCMKIFQKQLSRCKTDFFDFYLLQWINETNYITAKTAGGFDFLSELKEKGLAGKTGFSFYGSPALLEKILSENPDIDAVQLQINFYDWENPVFRAKECYETARKYNKEIIAAEPLKNTETEENIRSAAFRFVKNLPGVSFVLCDMNSIGFLSDIPEDSSISEKEISNLLKTAKNLRLKNEIPCIGCSSCEKICPVQIPVSRYFEVYNEYCRNPEESWKIEHVYSSLTGNFSRPTDCMRCRICEAECSGKINISEALQKTARTFGY